jgi:hypothetical protein
MCQWEAAAAAVAAAGKLDDFIFGFLETWLCSQF